MAALRGSEDGSLIYQLPWEYCGRSNRPPPAEIYDDRTDVDPSLIDAFNRRSGFTKPAERVDLAEIDGWIEDCTAAVG